MKKVFLIFLGAVLSVCLLLASAAQANEGDYQQLCASCHGQNGGGNAAITAPSIAGLQQDYLTLQLSNFKQGIRGSHPEDASGMMMAGIGKSLSDSQISSLAQYLAAQPFVAAKPPKQTGGFMGMGLYRNCGSCHGAHAQGEPSLHAPRLAGQHTGYLLAQLKKFKSGARGKHPEDKYGKQMNLVSQGLDFENQLASILAFIAHRKVTPVTKTLTSNKH